MASYSGPVITAACCTYWMRAENSLARSLLSRSMSCAFVTWRGAAGAAGLRAAFLAVCFGTGLPSALGLRADPIRRAVQRRPPRVRRGRPPEALASYSETVGSSVKSSSRPPGADPVEGEVEHRHEDEREDGGGEEPADDHHRQRRRQEGALAEAQRHGKQGEDRRDRRHQDGAQAPPAALDDRRTRVHTLATELLHEVEQHDGVGHHDADQHEQADEARHAQAGPREPEQQDGADSGERDADQQDERIDAGCGRWPP